MSEAQTHGETATSRSGPGYIVKHIDEVEPVPCPCGSSIRPITAKDTPVANIHVTHIMDSQKRYHKNLDEFYYILEGGGTMELGRNEVPLTTGTVIMIERGTPHRGYGDFRALIVGVPAMQSDDEFFVDE